LSLCRDTGLTKARKLFARRGSSCRDIRAALLRRTFWPLEAECELIADLDNRGRLYPPPDPTNRQSGTRQAGPISCKSVLRELQYMIVPTFLSVCVRSLRRCSI